MTWWPRFIHTYARAYHPPLLSLQIIIAAHLHTHSSRRCKRGMVSDSIAAQCQQLIAVVPIFLPPPTFFISRPASHVFYLSWPLAIPTLLSVAALSTRAHPPRVYLIGGISGSSGVVVAVEGGGDKPRYLEATCYLSTERQKRKAHTQPQPCSSPVYRLIVS